MPEIISREEALKRGLKRYFTGVACGHGHVCDRLVCNRHCTRCAGDSWRDRRRERTRERNLMQPRIPRVKQTHEQKKEQRKKWYERLKSDPERYEVWKERHRQLHSLHRSKQRLALRALKELGIEI